MMARTQISLNAEEHRRAKRRAAELGISLAEYVRRLIAEDLGTGRTGDSPEALFDLGDSGGTDVARDKDRLIAAAVSPGRR